MLTKIFRVTHRNIPDYFMERYDAEIAYWAHNFDKGDMIGPVHSIFLREGGFSTPSPDEEQGPEMLVVRLLAKVGVRGVEIEPYTEDDERIIANHCAKMELLGVPARVRLKEPPRPWLPFMPKIGTIGSKQ